MSELVEFIRGCLDADEQTARAAAEESAPDWQHGEQCGARLVETVHKFGNPGYEYRMGITHDQEGLSDSVLPAAGDHIARHDPARVLAEVNAKRAILDKHERASVAFEQSVNPATSAAVMALAEVVDELAQPFRGEPGWRDEWGTQ